MMDKKNRKEHRGHIGMKIKVEKIRMSDLRYQASCRQWEPLVYDESRFKEKT